MAETATPTDQYTVGVDFGTLSGRAVVVRISDGAEVGSAVHEYRHAVMDSRLTADDGQPLPPDWALQVPADYIEVLQTAIPQAVADAGVDPGQIVGIGTDFTACTMLPVTDDGTPLCALPEFADRPHAYVKLWKHHAAQAQADRITSLATERSEPWLPRYGGLTSSEWQFAKGLELLEEDPEIYRAMTHWLEAADWIVWQLSGRYSRNACTAGYKGLLHDGHYPSAEFCAALNPDFADFTERYLDTEVTDLGQRVGGLTPQAAQWTGLPAGIAVAAGNVDAHVTVPAADAVAPGKMVAIMGTSTCHVMNSDQLAMVPGMCGVVHGGISAGLWGYEAGQSGVGDIFAWFVDRFASPAYVEAAEAAGQSLHEYLTDLAAAEPIGGHGLIALDWQSGNRSVLVDHELSGLLVGLTLSTTPEQVYRALLEATAFGTRTIVEAFTASGVAVDELVVAGGLLKNRFLMQLYSDVTGLPLSTIVSTQGGALGSAIHAAVAAGSYPDVAEAGHAMGARVEGAYTPNPDAVQRYDALYAEYRTLHDYFGRGENTVMKRLKRIRRDALQASAVADHAHRAEAEAS